MCPARASRRWPVACRRPVRTCWTASASSSGSTASCPTRALTNFSGNAVATFLVGVWTKTIDLDQARAVLSGKDPFDYSTIAGAHDSEVKLGEVPSPVNPADSLSPTPFRECAGRPTC